MEAPRTDDPIDTEEEEPPLLSASATLNKATNSITVETDPNETGTIYTLANRINPGEFDGEPNYIYETSVVLVPEGVDLSEAFESAKSNYYYDLLREIGATELGVWELDPTASEGEPGAMPDFVYPEGIDTSFAQIYSVNFGDGGQIELISDVDGEETLLDDIDDLITSTSYNLVEDNGGAVVTLPTAFEGTLGVFETTTDFFFNDQLVRTEVTIQFSLIAPGTDFTEGTLALAEDVTQTNSETGPVYTISDGSLTERELLTGADGVASSGFSYQVSATEYDSDGAIVFQETTGGVGVNANVEIERYAVEAVGIATPRSSESSLWYGDVSGRLVSSFNPIDNVAAEEGAIEAGSLS